MQGSALHPLKTPFDKGVLRISETFWTGLIVCFYSLSDGEKAPFIRIEAAL